jgi:hypothetical protein
MEVAARPFIRGRLTDSGHKPLRGTVVIGFDEFVTTGKDGAFACPQPRRNELDSWIKRLLRE